MPNPVLYILARTDLESLNPGKLAAQCCHGANAAIANAKSSKNKHIQQILRNWEESTDALSFGTTIVLDADTEEKINSILKEFVHDPRVISGYILDPTYPLKDGRTLHYIPLVTCGYVFCDTEDNTDAIKLLRTVPLHP